MLSAIVKNLFASVVCASLFFGLTATNAQAGGSGSAFVPYWQSFLAGGTDTNSFIWVANTTANDLIVTVTFYDSAGTAVTSGITHTNFQTSDTEIAAGKTGLVTVSLTTAKYGYATVEWENKPGDTDVLACTAHGLVVSGNATAHQSYSSGVTVNGGQLF